MLGVKGKDIGMVKRWLGSNSTTSTPHGNIASPVATFEVSETDNYSSYEQQLSLMESAFSSNSAPMNKDKISLLCPGLMKCNCFNSTQNYRAHIVELLAFVGWILPGMPTAIQSPFIWYVFWAHVCNLGREESAEKMPLFTYKILPLWVLWLVSVIYLRNLYHSKVPAMISEVIRYLEFFVLSGLLVTISANICSFLHTPAEPLFDLGFRIIPAQTVDSPWRPVSDILAQGLPIILCLNSCFMSRTERCKLLVNWLRLISLAYIFRALTVTLTSLPGPAPHCNKSDTYHPPFGWHDIATRLGPMVGDYSTCGDLIFSGHTAFTTMTMLCLIKTFRNCKRYRIVRIMGFLYVGTMATFALSGRKHYSVDIVVAILVSCLTFYRFQNGWTGNSADDLFAGRTPLVSNRKDTLDLPSDVELTQPISSSLSRQSSSLNRTMLI